MKNVMGVIYTGENDARLRDLTLYRAIAALPVAGRYRVIDFLISSMVNSGMKNIGVIMQKNYHSLMDHIGSGKEWDLHGKNDGLKVLPPFLTRENVGVYAGSLDALRSNSSYLTRSKQEWVVLSGSNIIYNCNFDDMVLQHIESGADITMMYTRDESMRREEFGTYMNIDANGNVIDIEVEPTRSRPEYVCGMEVFVMKRELLRTLVDEGVAHGMHGLTKDLLTKMLRDNEIKIGSFEYKGMCWRLDSVTSYFQFNMDVLNSDLRHQLFSKDLPVYTKVRDEMPAYYASESNVVNSLVGDGCIIEGKVENCILFRGVHIAPGAHVKNCIIMQDGHVHADAYIENCILDKQSVIKRNAKLIGPAVSPIVIGKNVVI